MADNSLIYPTGTNPTTLSGADQPGVVEPSTAAPQILFPDSQGSRRLSMYNYYELLFLGQHYDAFNMQISSGEYNRAYSKLRYVMVNFAGLISKIVADMLFSEQLTVTAQNQSQQDQIEKIWQENSMDIQCYESALSNSYEGDALFKVRVGKRHPNDQENTVIIEDVTPKIYFPVINPFNTRDKPLKDVLAWVFQQGNKRYLRKEIHEPGWIYNEVYEMDGNVVKGQVGLEVLGIPDILPAEETGIDDSLIIHIPNWKVGNRTFGLSDYFDLDSLFFGINNRMTKIDNILDKHSDPILMVPEGILDENGRVKKGNRLSVIEIKEGEDKKPEYIVWDASLENAFKEIEKMVEFIYMVGEVSPDVLGLGTGVSDSGRALKFKLMRTIAKVARKKLYYYRGIREALYVAQKLAVVQGVKIDGKSLTGEIERPDLRFADGLPIDDSEQIDTEQKAIDAGITSTKDSMIRVYHVDEATADKKLAEIKAEGAVPMPVSGIGGPSPDPKPMIDPKTGKPMMDPKTGKPMMTPGKGKATPPAGA